MGCQNSCEEYLCKDDAFGACRCVNVCRRSRLKSRMIQPRMTEISEIQKVPKFRQITGYPRHGYIRPAHQEIGSLAIITFIVLLLMFLMRRH